MKRVNINQLHIRLKGISAPVARSAVAGLGDQVLAQLTGQNGLGGAQGTIKISGIDSGKILGTRGATAADVRRMMARAVAEAIISKSEPK